MPKQLLTLNNFSGGVNNLRDPRDIDNNQLVTAQNVMLDHNGIIRSRGSFATHGDAGARYEGSIEGGYGFKSFEIDYTVGATSISSRTDIGYTAASAGNHIIYTTGTDLRPVFPVGSEILVTGSTSNDGFHTVKSHAAPAANKYLVVGDTTTTEAAGDSTSISYHKYGESLFLLGDAGEPSVGHYLKSTDAVTEEVVKTFSGAYVPMVPARFMYYVVDNAVRVCDTRMRDSTVGSNAGEVQWWGFVKRVHFEPSLSKYSYMGFYANNNRLTPPTEAAIGSGYLSTAGAGFNITTTMSSDAASTWEADTYQIAISFIYDDNQESLLYAPSSNKTFSVTAGQKVAIVIRAEGPYDERISGGRAYFRPNGSGDSPWTLLADISLKEGARVSLLSDYDGAWTDDTPPQFYSASVDSLNPNLDTYETLNGYPSSVDSNSIGKAGEGWGCAVVCNRRAFIANIKIIPPGSDQPTSYGDRIMYSMPNRFDTFPSFNFIDVVRGDNEVYVHLMEYADRILAFKQKSVQIINVSSSSDTGWFLEENVKHNGIVHPAAAFRTDYGICWVNENGCYLYNGSRITNLIEGKILEDGTASGDCPSWSSFITDGSIVGYEKKRKQIIVMKDCFASVTDSGNAYIYDFKFKSWIFATDLLTDGDASNKDQYSNFDIDYNGDLCLQLFNEYEPGDGELDGAITDTTAVTFDVGAGGDYDSGDIVNYDAESMKVLSISSNTLTVKRGYNGTTAATHSNAQGGVLHSFNVKKYVNTTLYNGATSTFLVKTKDIDFGQPGVLKKIYAVYITYKSDNAQTTPISYETDGTTNSYTNLTGNFSASASWAILKAYPSTPFTCQSLQLKITNPTNVVGSTAGIQINDITIEYRTLHKKVG